MTLTADYFRPTMTLRATLLFAAVPHFFFAHAQQDPDARLKELQTQLEQLEAQEKALMGPIEDAKLSIMQRDLAALGLPALATGDVVTVHPGHSLVWDEVHHVPKWTAHIVLPDIMKGNLAASTPSSRTRM